MNHSKIRKFGRVRRQRVALMRGLVRSLIIHEKIKTTEAKAKSLRPMIEKMLTRAKVDSVHNRRVLSAKLGNDPEVVDRLIKEIAPKYKDRNGGYTRITKIVSQSADARKNAIIEFV